MGTSRDVPAKGDSTRRAALAVLIAGIIAIAVGYASAFQPNKQPAPMWGAWCLALGIPIAIVAIMILGAVKSNRGLGALTIPFVLVGVILIVGFGAALALPATESATSALWLGLPARAAVVIYGVGLLPIVVLPIAYALTFESQTLDQSDLDRVRELANRNAARADVLRADSA